jgi:hypothetical protein
MMPPKVYKSKKEYTPILPQLREQNAAARFECVTDLSILSALK